MNLQDQLKFLESIIETASDAILTFDEQGTIMTSNLSVQSIFGFSPDELVGKSLSLLLPDSHNKEHEKAFLQYLKTGDKGFLGIGKRIEVQKKDGTMIPASFTISEMQFQNKRLFSIVFRDITNILNTEKELEKTTRELARSNADLEKFAAVAAHDLQAPLRTIAMLINKLGNHHKNVFDEQSSDWFQRIEGGVKRMQSLINDLLVFCQLRTSKNNISSVDTNMIFDQVISDLMATISDCQGRVTRDELPTITADEGQIRQLFQNLISNALKFRRPDSTPEVHVKATEDDSNWKFSVIDNGIGIETKYFERIVLPFQRLHSRNEYAGNGIGLAICKSIIEQHNGILEIESKVGHGSQFHITIPKTTSHAI